MKIKNYLLMGLFLLSGMIFANSVSAVCPLCVVAVGAGLGLSRWLGVDDVVSSLWIGALLASVTIWTIIWLVKKGRGFKSQKIVVPAAYYLLTLLPLYLADIAGHPLNKIFGIDKIVFGTVLGTAIFLLSVKFHNFLKTKNNGKSFFQYQKVVVPVAILAVVSIVLYFVI